jgi:hypothetical protein
MERFIKLWIKNDLENKQAKKDSKLVHVTDGKTYDICKLSYFKAILKDKGWSLAD